MRVLGEYKWTFLDVGTKSTQKKTNRAEWGQRKLNLCACVSGRLWHFKWTSIRKSVVLNSLGQIWLRTLINRADKERWRMEVRKGHIGKKVERRRWRTVVLLIVWRCFKAQQRTVCPLGAPSSLLLLSSSIFNPFVSLNMETWLFSFLVSSFNLTCLFYVLN